MVTGAPTRVARAGDARRPHGRRPSPAEPLTGEDGVTRTRYDRRDA